MNRVNGYVILDDYIDEEERETEEFQSSSKGVKEGKLRFWLEIENNQRVFFKLCGGNEFNELIAEEILNILGIPCAHYDLAIFNGIKGVISYDYKEKNIKYIKGYTILKEYYDYLEANDKFENLLPDEKIDFMDDEDAYSRLDIIWDALYYHYRDRENVYEIVKKLMQELVIKRNIDLILLNNDDQAHNWEIMESVKEISLSPYFDNTRFFETEDILLQTTFGKVHNIKEDLEEYMRLSSEENILEFIHLFNKIDGALLGNAINKAIQRTNYKPNEDYIKRIFAIFNRNRKMILSVIENYQENKKLGD